MTDVLYDKNDVGRNEKLLKSMRPGTGRRIKEDFSVVNIADLFDTDEEGNLFLRVTLIGGGGSSPLTTKGDIYVYGPTNTRLAVGTYGQVLSADPSEPTGLRWVDLSDVSAVWGHISGLIPDQTDLQNVLNDKQATLVSATNIKTINGNSILGAGDLTIAGGVPYSGATGDVDLGNYDLVATELHASSLIQANKLGTATAENPIYNSGDIVLESSAWDTDNNRADTHFYKFRNRSGSATTTNANLYLYYQTIVNGVTSAETQLGYFDASGRPNFVGYLASGSTGFVGNLLYPYNSTFLTIKGRIPHSATGQAIKVFGGTASGSPTMGEQLLSYYAGNGDFQVGGVDALDGFSFQRTGTKQTTDATQQAVTGTGAVLTTTTGQIYQVRAMVVGKQGTTNVAGVEIVATVRNVGGTATIVGAVQQVAPNQSAGDWGTAGTFATFTVSGADVRVSVQGKAGTTIDWRMQMDYITY